jgi:hypothetical protein
MDWDAVLPGALFAGFPGSCEVVVHLGGTARYIDNGGVMAVARCWYRDQQDTFLGVSCR